MGRRALPYILFASISLVGLVFCFSGWENAYAPYSNDTVGNRNNARVLVDSGNFPVTAGLSSLGAYNPPGGSWYFVPSVLFDDILIGERFSIFLLYLLTIVPMFLIGRHVADTRTALILVLLYTVSAIGLTFEHAVGYRARPFTYAWLLYFSIRWLETGRGRHLFGAILSLGYGLLIFWEMGPVVVGMAFAYWKFRPKIAWGPLIAGVTVVLLLWLPYLNFQVERDFVDIRASLTLSKISPDFLPILQSYGDRLGSWSAPDDLGPFTLPESLAKDRVEKPVLRRVLNKIKSIPEALIGNFTGSHPWGPLPLGIVILFLIVAWDPLSRLPDKILRSRLLDAVGVAFVVGALVANEIVLSMMIGSDLTGGDLWGVRKLQAAGVLLGIVFLKRQAVVGWLTDATTRLGFGGAGQPPLPVSLKMMVYLVVPTWIAFSMLASVPRYMKGFWVWQLLLVGLFLACNPRRVQRQRWLPVAGLGLAFLLVLPNEGLNSMVNEWSEPGYSGTRNEVIVVADSLAQICKSTNLANPRIGYFVSFAGFQLVWGLQDERFGGIGLALSQYIELQHGLSPVKQPPEGFSAQDDFRIVETKRGDLWRAHRFVLTDREKYRSVARWDRFEILARTTDGTITENTVPRTN